MNPSHHCSVCPLGRASAPDSCPFKPRPFPRNARILRQGDPPGMVLFVREGTVMLSTVEADGSELTSIRGPGALLGAEALAGLPSPFEVRALTDVVVCALAVEDVTRWVGPSPSPAQAVISLLAADASERHRASRASSGSSEGRLARHLLELGESAHGLPKLRVAQLLGMRPETFSRALGKLARRGLVDRKLKILDRDGLADCAAGMNEPGEP